MTNQIVGAGIVGSYPNADGNIYEVPLYNVTVSGGGKSYNFNAIRFGVVNGNGVLGPRMTGLENNQTHTLSWDPYMNGSWRIFGHYLIHRGAADPSVSAWAAIGCIEITGLGGWSDFNNRIREISGENDLGVLGASGQISVTFQAASLPPLVTGK